MSSHLSRPNKQQVTSVMTQSIYQGLLPPPEMLEHYGRIYPELPEKLTQLAIDEAKHRHYCEKKTTRAFSRSAILGMVFAFLSVIIVSFLVYYALTLGYPTQAATIATGVIVALAGVFVFRRQQRKTDQPKR
jgi:uncharacterized membrane protein